ncbi:unnamed protein product [Arctogadus glacialis]
MPRIECASRASSGRCAQGEDRRIDGSTQAWRQDINTGFCITKLFSWRPGGLAPEGLCLHQSSSFKPAVVERCWEGQRSGGSQEHRCCERSGFPSLRYEPYKAFVSRGIKQPADGSSDSHPWPQAVPAAQWEMSVGIENAVYQRRIAALEGCSPSSPREEGWELSSGRDSRASVAQACTAAPEDMELGLS